jgi:glycosyltransferase involved in cell wall biosynthesis
MNAYDASSKGVPLFSIIIGVFNDWVSLNACLRSLADVASTPSFEVVVVDDGSNETAPQFIADWGLHYALRITRQVHLGISAARNHGLQLSRGSVLLFVDADCKFELDCLCALAANVKKWPQHNCFQLRIVGEPFTLLGRMEELRLLTLQSHLIQSDGCIRYLNTAGFALRRSCVDVEKGVFDPLALRAEDTLLLANLIQAGELPFFAADATIRHAVSMSLMKCFRKDLQSAYLAGVTYNVIDSKGVRIRVTNRERFRMLKSMWKASKQKSIGRSSLFVLVGRQALRLLVLLFTRTFNIKRKPHRDADFP